MPYPKDSTHLREWIFTPEALKALRQEVYGNAKESLIEKLKQNNVSSNNPEIPSLHAIEQLVCYFVPQLIHVCTEKHLEYRVINTAVTFFIRFFLKRSALEYDPRKILLTSILLSVKIEECRGSCSVAHFCDGLISTRIRLREIVDSELTLLDALSFSIRILHARYSIHYYTTEYYHTFKSQQGDVHQSEFSRKITQLNADAEKLSLQALEDSEIPFLFSPAELGTACFLNLCSLDSSFGNAESFFQNLLRRQTSSTLTMDTVRPVLLDIRTRLTCFVENKRHENQETRAQQALKTLKQIDRLLKLINKDSSKKKQKHKLASSTSCLRETTINSESRRSTIMHDVSQNNNTAEQNFTPISQNNKTAEQNFTPISQNNKTAEQNFTPISQNNKTAEQNFTPISQNNKTAEQNFTPISQNNKTAEQSLDQTLEVENCVTLQSDNKRHRQL